MLFILGIFIGYWKVRNRLVVVCFLGVSLSRLVFLNWMLFLLIL